MMRNKNAIIAGAVVFLANAAASAYGGSNLPWDSAMVALKTSIGGPVASGIALVGVTVAGTTMVLNHHDPGHFGKTGIAVATGLGVVLAGGGLITALYPTAGFLI